MSGGTDQPTWGNYVDAYAEPDPTAYGSRLARQGGHYRAFVPPLISELPFSISSDVAEHLASASSHLAALRQQDVRASGVRSLAETLLRSESVASSRIEGVAVSHARLARERFRHGPEDKKAREVLGNVDAMRKAIELGASSERLGPEALRAIHQALVGDEQLRGHRYGGVIREEQNWIGGNAYNPVGAAFVPPPADDVGRLLADLGEFVQRRDLDPVAHAAVAHAQFETIHPFLDGNGRVGRALVYAILRRRQAVGEYLPPISLVLGANSRSYIAGLTAYRAGDPEAIVDTFAGAVSRACEQAVRLTREVSELQTAWREKLSDLRSHAGAIRLLELLPGHPVLTAAVAHDLTGLSVVSATDALVTLEQRGIVQQRGGARKWGRTWEAQELFQLVGSFEARTTGGRVRTVEPRPLTPPLSGASAHLTDVEPPSHGPHYNPGIDL